jgi:hypothetical protein
VARPDRATNPIPRTSLPETSSRPWQVCRTAATGTKARGVAAERSIVTHLRFAISIVDGAMFCERGRFRYHSGPLMGIRAMEESAISRVVVGPYGLHAFGAIVLIAFLTFLWAFNFTTFF